MNYYNDRPNNFDDDDSDEDFGFDHLALIAGITLALWIIIIWSLFYFN